MKHDWEQPKEECTCNSSGSPHRYCWHCGWVSKKCWGCECNCECDEKKEGL